MSGSDCCFLACIQISWQFRWSGIPISWRIFQCVVIDTVEDFGIINKCFSLSPDFLRASHSCCWLAFKVLWIWRRSGFSRVTVCPGLPGIVLVYTYCSGIIINSTPFHSQTCPSLEDKLYRHSAALRLQLLAKFHFPIHSLHRLLTTDWWKSKTPPTQNCQRKSTSGNC